MKLNYFYFSIAEITTKKKNGNDMKLGLCYIKKEK